MTKRASKRFLFHWINWRMKSKQRPPLQTHLFRQKSERERQRDREKEREREREREREIK
jgi:hypothetical protein